jgi:hypothetical protein
MDKCGYTISMDVLLCGYTISMDVLLCGYTISMDVLLFGYTISMDVLLCGYTISMDVFLCGYTISMDVLLYYKVLRLFCCLRSSIRRVYLKMYVAVNITVENSVMAVGSSGQFINTQLLVSVFTNKLKVTSLEIRMYPCLFQSSSRAS